MPSGTPTFPYVPFAAGVHDSHKPCVDEATAMLPENRGVVDHYAAAHLTRHLPTFILMVMFKKLEDEIVN